MLRRLIPLLLCLVAVALWIRFQGPPPATIEPFKLAVRLNDPGSRLYYEFSQSAQGSEYRYEVLSDGQTFKGSGHLESADASRFRAELERRQVWKLRGHSDVKQVGSLSVTEGQRSHVVALSITDTELVGWLFQKDNLPVRSMQKSLAK